MSELLVSVFSNVTMLILLGALVVFGISSLQYRKIKSFQFQISLVLIILIISEVIDVLFDFNYIENNNLEYFGNTLHVLAMAGIALIFWGRFIHAQKTRTKFLDGTQK